jgi:hypothetical protein
MMKTNENDSNNNNDKSNDNKNSKKNKNRNKSENGFEINSKKNNYKNNKKNKKANSRKPFRNFEKSPNNEIAFSSAVSNDIKEIWKSFEKYGHLQNMVVKDTGFHGSGVSRMILRPGEEGTITLVMAWHYPFRDHAGETVGQYYGYV